MAKKSACRRFFKISALIFFGLFLNALAFAQSKGVPETPLASLVTKFKKAANLPCGQRAEAFRIGREIIARFFTDKGSFKTADWAAKQLRVIEKQEAQCKPDNARASLGVLFEEFKIARRQPCGERDSALRFGREILQRFSTDELNKEVIDYVKAHLPKIEAEEKSCKEANSLEVLFEDFKNFGKRPCGKRNDAISTGNRIIELYGADEISQEVIRSVEKDIPKIKEEDRICARNERFDTAYKYKNWYALFSVGKEIIDEEGDKPLALDVMLTLVRVGYRLSAIERNETYNLETLRYANKALELIESGVGTSNRWGIFEPFETMDKAQAWCNFAVGYVSYFRLKETKKAIPYFYKATRYKSEFKFDAFVYQAVAIHYFEKEAVSASSLTINDFIVQATSLGEINDQNFSAEEAEKYREIAMLYRQLVNLYNLRYNLASDENANGLTDYILKLINRPLVDTAAPNSKYKIRAQTK